MSEQLENQEQQVEMTELNPFSENAWIDDLSEKTEEDTQTVEVEQQTENNDAVESSSENNQSQDEEVYDADEYLKQTLGFDSWEAAKEEIERLRTSKGSKYENEESEIIHKALLEGKVEDVYSYLDKQIKINKLLSSEIDEKNAEEIVKLSMKSKYTNLTDDEIEYKYKKQFSIPKEPEQKYTESDEEFEERYKAWEEKAKDVKMELMIEAKSSRNEIENLKNNLKLPEISDNNINKSLSQEELAEVNKFVENYVRTVDETVDSFNGFSVGYKDEGASIQSTYTPSAEEKKAVSEILKNFASNNFNANVIFAERWLNSDGSINVPQMTKDVSLLYSEEKVMQKLVNDGINKRIAEYRKSTSNIKVSGQSNGTFKPEGNGANDMAAFFFGQ